MTKRIAVISAVLILLISTGASDTRADDGQRLVDVTVSLLTANCGLETRSQLTYRFFGEDESKERALPPTEDVAGLRSIHLRLVPGQYALVVKPSSRIVRNDANERELALNCVSQFSFTVIPDHPRHLAAILGTNFYGHNHCAVAGALPVAGLGLALIHPAEPPSSAPESRYWWWTIPGGKVEVDGAAYYVEPVLPLHYNLVIHDFASDTDVEIPLDLTKQFTADSQQHCSGLFVRNITREELQKLFQPSGAIE